MQTKNKFEYEYRAPTAWVLDLAERIQGAVNEFEKDGNLVRDNGAFTIIIIPDNNDTCMHRYRLEFAAETE